MIVVYPIGGVGERFKAVGIATPKPLLEAKGETLFSRTQASYANLPGSRIVIARQEYFNSGLAKALIQPTYTVPIPEGISTRGPVETLLQVQFPVSDELLIADCDSFFDSPRTIVDALHQWHLHKAEGGVTVRRTADPGCCFVSMDPEGFVTEVREKDPFSQWSATGPYYWRNAQLFAKYAKQAVEEGIFSVGEVFNYLLKSHAGKVFAVPVEDFHHLGTPKELDAYNAST